VNASSASSEGVVISGEHATNGSAGRADLPSSLAGVADVLWPHSPEVWVGGGEPPAGFRIVETFSVLPNARHPRLLVPTLHPRAAAASLRQFNQGMSQIARLRKAAVGMALRTPAARFAARDTITVALAGSIDEADAGGLLLSEHLRRLLGVSPITISVSLGPIRPNMKPVLQLLTHDGRAVGYAKVAWNSLTSRLVTHEASILRAWGEGPPSTFDVPALLGTGSWAGREILVTSPVPHRLIRSGPLNGDIPDATLREIAERAGRSHSVLAAHPYWPSLRARVENAAGEARRAEVEGILDGLEERHGADDIEFGAWHGDLAPGNTSIVGGRLHLWDWERSEAGVPLGLDPIHFHYQLVSFAGGRRVREAARTGLERADGALVALGVPRDRHRLLSSLYLLERFVRYEEGRSEGTLGAREATIDELLEVLREGA
jgi:hypothetical protein